jgi:hypothetical protein
VNNPPLADSPGFDDDMDEFFIIPGYTWKNGSADMTFLYIRNRAYNEQGGPGFNPAFWANANYGNAGWGIDAANYALDMDIYMINPAVMMKFGPFSLHAEAAYAWMEMRPDRGLYPNENTWPDVKGSGYGFYIDGIYNYGPGEAGAMFTYTSGRNFDDTNTVDGNMEGILGIGNADNMGMFLVAQERGLLNRMDLINTSPADRLGAWNNMWSVGIWNDYNVTEDLILHAAFGYFQLVNAPDQTDINNVLGVGATEDPAKDIGFEFDISGCYKIMDGLTFTTGFGYFWGGKAWKYGNAAIEVGNAYAWKNQLILNF